MKLTICADLHGHLPSIPECDILLIAGDVCPLDDAATWLDTRFRDWLEREPAETVVGIAGNHDFPMEQREMPDGLRWEYLEDSGIDIAGLRIWGTPWQPYFGGWAFNAPPGQAVGGGEDFLADRFERIPSSTDVLLSHGPPFGILDKIPNGPNVGSKALRNELERIKPRLLVCGHIHAAHGHERVWYGDQSVECYNVALADEYWMPVRLPTVIEL